MELELAASERRGRLRSDDEQVRECVHRPWCERSSSSLLGARSYRSGSRRLHSLPRVECSANVDRNRPGVVERTLDCIEAHTPPVYDQDASEEETCEARLAVLELKKATENRRHRERRRINKLQCRLGLKKVSQDIFKCIKTIPLSQDEARKYQVTPSCDIQTLSCDGAISAHSTVSQHVRLMTEGTHLEMCVPRQHNFISLSGVASRGSDISRRPCVMT